MKIADGFYGEKAIITPSSIRELQQNNEITKQLYITHIGYYPVAKHHFIERENGTNEHIMVYCLEGEGWVNFGDEKQKVTPNTCFILPANAFHSYGSSNHNPWSIYWFHFQGTQAQWFSSIMSKVISLKEASGESLQHRESLLDEIFQNLEMGYQIESLEYISICLLNVLASIKYVSKFDTVNRLENLDVIQKSILFMKANLDLKITLEDIAQHVGYSASHFGALFLSRTKYSPMAYLNQLKIQKACALLQFSNLKIKEIAYLLKFYDPYHFSKVFSSEMELTPRDYRNKYQKEFKKEIIKESVDA